MRAKKRGVIRIFFSVVVWMLNGPDCEKRIQTVEFIVVTNGWNRSMFFNSTYNKQRALVYKIQKPRRSRRCNIHSVDILLSLILWALSIFGLFFRAFPFSIVIFRAFSFTLIFYAFMYFRRFDLIWTWLLYTIACV